MTTELQVFQKWGDVARGGFQAVPDLLLKNQRLLGLSATDLVVLLNVLMNWWYADQKPHLRPTSISRRTGVTVRTVQRTLKNLETLGFISRTKLDGRTVVNPEGLVGRLLHLAETDPDYLVRKARRSKES